MTDLILAGQEATMTSLEIAELVEKRHDNVKRTIDSLSLTKVDKHGMEIPAVIQRPQSEEVKNHLGQTVSVFKICKRSSFIVVAQLSPEFTARLVDRWQELENGAIAKPKTALELAKEQVLLLEQIEQKDKLIAEQKPKALFADAVTSSASSILVGQLAKLIKQNGVDMGQNRLFVWMRDSGYLVKQRGENFNLPTQRSMDSKLFEIKVTTVDNRDGSKRRTSTTKVTGKGQVYFINKFLGEVA
jgi:phage antirepressor YoqD-like protein